MAFAGMFLAGIIIFILLFFFFCMMASFIIAILIKKSNKKNTSKKKKILGNLFLTIGILLAIPMLGVAASAVFYLLNSKISLPDGGEEYVSASVMKNMMYLLAAEDKISIDELKYCLEKEPALIYYYDANRLGVIDHGLERGDAEVVKLALSFGAVFDSPERYEYMAYSHGSMDSYLDDIIGREITRDDIEILQLMFEHKVSTEVYTSKGTMYSNVFGKAVWSVLYNDKTITDTELEFIQVFIDNGLLTDDSFTLYEDKPNHVYFSSEYCFDIIKDDNYYKLININDY